MKTNKKAILGMLVAMVMSLGVMGGINAKSNDSNLMQLGYCAYAASKNTDNMDESAINGATSAMAIGAGSACLKAAIPLAATPAGWVALGLAATFYV